MINTFNISNGELLPQLTPNFEINIVVVIKLSGFALFSSNIKPCFLPLESVENPFFRYTNHYTGGHCSFSSLEACV